MNTKTKKIVNIIVNVVVVIILAFVLIITLSMIFSRGKGYTEMFGKTRIAVISDSMDGPKPEGVDSSKPAGFKKGDLITVKILDGAEKRQLEVGDIITFYQVENGERIINTHRIVSIKEFTPGYYYYYTRGDNTPGQDPDQRTASDIIGKYTGQKIGGLGGVITFIRSSAGFFVFIVIPSFIIVAYFTVNLILTIKKSKKEAALQAAGVTDEKELMKQQLLQELIAEGKVSADAVQTPAENAEQQETAEEPEQNEQGQTETEQESAETEQTDSIDKE